MNSKFFIKVLLISIALCGSNAWAADDTEPPSFDSGRLYISAFGGGAFAEDSDTDYTSLTVTKFKYKNGYQLGGALGYQTRNRKVRFEFETTYRKFGVKSVKFEAPAFGFSTGEFAAEGDVTLTIFMINLFYDWRAGKTFRPFVGVGGGFGVAKLDDIRVNNIQIINSRAPLGAGQIMLGFSWKLLDSLDFTASYGTLFTSHGIFVSNVATFVYRDFVVNDLRAGFRFYF